LAAHCFYHQPDEQFEASEKQELLDCFDGSPSLGTGLITGQASD